MCGTDLFDPEMLDEAMEEANVLIEALLAEDFLPLLIDNLGRLDEAVDEQAEAVHNVLGTVEHRTPHQHSSWIAGKRSTPYSSHSLG